MTTRKQILIAIAELTTPFSATNTRRIAGHLSANLGHINCYFYENLQGITPFQNGDLVQWSEKSNTLRLGPNAAVIRHNGQVVDIGRVEKV